MGRIPQLPAPGPSPAVGLHRPVRPAYLAKFESSACCLLHRWICIFSLSWPSNIFVFSAPSHILVSESHEFKVTNTVLISFCMRLLRYWIPTRTAHWNPTLRLLSCAPRPTLANSSTEDGKVSTVHLWYIGSLMSHDISSREPSYMVLFPQLVAFHAVQRVP